MGGESAEPDRGRVISCGGSQGGGAFIRALSPDLLRGKHRPYLGQRSTIGRGAGIFQCC